MTKWTEVNVYTGRPVDEDAPTSFAGAGSGVDMNPTGMKKKKKLVDARTKSYKTHRARLEAARVKREAKRNGVKEEVKLDEAKFKVGDIVIPSEGPHKGRKHEVIADLKNNTYNIRPIGLLAKQIQYRLGAAKAKANQIKLVKEEVKTKFSEKVIESVSEFNVESLLAEDNVDVLRSIVKNKAMKPIKLKDGTMKVDLFTASAIIQVLDKVKPANKTKLTKMLNGKKSDFMRASEGIMKMIGKKR